MIYIFGYWNAKTLNWFFSLTGVGFLCSHEIQQKVNLQQIKLWPIHHNLYRLIILIGLQSIDKRKSTI